MGSRAARLVLLCVLAAAIAACSDDKNKTPEANPNILPARYQVEVTETLREQIFAKNDTTSITGAMITEPILRTVGTAPRYVVCVRYVAHGTAYNITANVERIGYFYAGHLNQLVETTGDECKGAAYKPFPDLDKACIGTGCKSR
jgi:hypothetical protein